MRILIPIAVFIIITFFFGLFAIGQIQEIDNLNQTVADLQKNNMENQNVIGELQYNSTILEGNLDKALSELFDTRNTTRQLIEGQISELESQMKILETQKNRIVDLNNVINQKNNHISERDKEIQDRESDIENLENSIFELENEVESLRLQLESLSNQTNGDFDLEVLLNKHDIGSQLSEAECLECHEYILNEQLAGRVATGHISHMRNQLTNFECQDCHSNINITLRWGDPLRVGLNNEICVDCHTTFMTKIWMGYETKPEQWIRQFPNCESCHEDWRKEMEDAIYVTLNAITEKDCVTCHALNVIFPSDKDPVTLACELCHGEE